MARDSVANVVFKLRERGFDPRRLGAESWEARCPAHRGTDYSLAIARTEQGKLILACRSKHCPFGGILRALELSPTRLSDTTPNVVLRKLANMPIVAPRFVGSSAPPDAPAEPAAPAAQSLVALQAATTAGSAFRSRHSPRL